MSPSGARNAERLADLLASIQIGDTLRVHGTRTVIGVSQNRPVLNRTPLICRIYYSGGPFELIDTHITNSTLILNQPAKNIYSAIQIFKMKSPGSKIVSD